MSALKYAQDWVAQQNEIYSRTLYKMPYSHTHNDKYFYIAVCDKEGIQIITAVYDNRHYAYHKETKQWSIRIDFDLADSISMKSLNKKIKAFKQLRKELNMLEEANHDA